MNSDPPPEGHHEPPLAQPVPTPPAPAPPPHTQTHRPSRLLSTLLLLGLAGSLALNAILLVADVARLVSFDADRNVQEEFFSHKRSSQNKVAIISLEGTIIKGDGFVKRQIDQAADDPDLKAVVLRVNSPGGTITGSDYIYHHLRKLTDESKIPIVVSMGGLAASGGYYVSMACGEKGTIFAEPTTWTGSIGVIIPHYNLSELLEGWGIEEDSIASHPLKKAGSFANPMTEQERQIFQALVDDGFSQFKKVIKRGRPAFQEQPEALDELATGQIFSAQQALESGLIDEIGFIEDAVDKAIELADLDEKDVTVVKYRQPPSLLGVLVGGEVRRQQFDLAAMLEMTAPRAYYLCTWLPPLAGTAKLCTPART